LEKSLKNTNVVVIGADGYVGSILVNELKAQAVVYNKTKQNEILIENLESTINNYEVIINSAGFRVMKGLTYQDYHRSHFGETKKLLKLLTESQFYIHISSASVYGSSKLKIRPDSVPMPMFFPCPNYAIAKYEADFLVMKYATKKKIKFCIVRPAVLYSPNGEGMVATLLKFAKIGIILRLLPAKSIHHMCFMDLFVESMRKICEKKLESESMIIADPFCISNERLCGLIEVNAKRKINKIPIPLHILSSILRKFPNLKNPKLDFSTMGEILGIMNLNSSYYSSDIFKILGIIKNKYCYEKSLKPMIEKELS